MGPYIAFANSEQDALEAFTLLRFDDSGVVIEFVLQGLEVERLDVLILEQQGVFEHFPVLLEDHLVLELRLNLLNDQIVVAQLLSYAYKVRLQLVLHLSDVVVP